MCSTLNSEGKMKTEIINDNSAVTANSKQVELLKTHFPQCFDKDGNFIMQKMQEVVSDEGLELSKESYSLNWLGKSYARLLANENPLTLLKEDKEHNSQAPHSDSHNLLIKGDNLEVLKHLSNAYNEAIKMIYIDPPYNTGSDGFVYQDDRKFTAEELSQLAGVDIEEAKHILEFTQSKANSHSAWLTFMYPRLYVARQLLEEDGVIFISIDDNEQAQLKLLCDEVFGEENFIAQYIHKNNSSKNQAKLVSVSTEYFYCYAKNKPILGKNTWRLRKKGAADIAKLFSNLLKKNFTLDEIALEIKEMYKRPKYAHLSRWNKVDEYGVFKDADLSREGGAKGYTIINPNTSKECVIPERGWGKSHEELLRLQEKDLIWYGDETTAPAQKDYINPDDTSVPDSFWYFDNSIDTRWIKKEFGRLVFENPKPLEMLIQILEMSVQNDSIILDFFAGSGTSAHAVMQLNSQDKGNRKFITVQIAEQTEKKSEAHKAGYKTIFDITKARIEKAAAKISEESPEYQGDLGFKIFETVSVFEGYLDDIEKLEDSSTLFDGRTLNKDELTTLLTTWRVYDGMPLDEKLEEVELNTYRAYSGNGTVYMMNEGFETDDLKAFIKKLDEESSFEPSKVVLFGYNFSSKHQREFKEALASYMNRKSIELDLIVRY